MGGTQTATNRSKQRALLLCECSRNRGRFHFEHLSHNPRHELVPTAGLVLKIRGVSELNDTLCFTRSVGNTPQESVNRSIKRLFLIPSGNQDIRAQLRSTHTINLLQTLSEAVIRQASNFLNIYGHRHDTTAHYWILSYANWI